ncbi:2-C-methyl-D-erythritol 4-phosphate cytidylyltransferase [Polaromonas sp. Pch-P]|uniref:2-C-methyl-D-erythritol 4-phosphate cytidylyltransferase n=1 Tax=Polaromonas sp. Pch-P TaxID=2082385 RepID=UPI00351AF593
MTTSPANTRSGARFFVLIPCAGQGSRAGTARAKQYHLIDGRPMVRHTVEAFRALAGSFAAVGW